jgi:hypothetical protein
MIVIYSENFLEELRRPSNIVTIGSYSLDNIPLSEVSVGTIEEFSEKRSLSANAYFYVLVGKLANALHASTTEVHNWLIAEYGQVDTDLGMVSLEERIDWRRLDQIHLKPTAEYIIDNDLAFRKYWVVRGSHTYNTKEMSRLIDGTVQEAKNLGIETMTPDELERLKATWRE